MLITLSPPGTVLGQRGRGQLGYESPPPAWTAGSESRVEEVYNHTVSIILTDPSRAIASICARQAFIFCSPPCLFSSSTKLGFMIADMVHGLGVSHEYSRRMKCCLASIERKKNCRPACPGFSSSTVLRSVLAVLPWQFLATVCKNRIWGVSEDHHSLIRDDQSHSPV